MGLMAVACSNGARPPTLKEKTAHLGNHFLPEFFMQWEGELVCL
jgi:hypothetical protein